MDEGGVNVSAFNDGKLVGGLRAEGTFPRLCIPCLRGTAFFWAVGSVGSPFKLNQLHSLVYQLISFNKQINPINTYKT